jgi:hypothetical protein
LIWSSCIMRTITINESVISFTFSFTWILYELILKKNDVLSVIKKFVKLTFTQYEQIVRFIRINDEQTLSIEYDNFMKMRKINTKRIVSYTSTQNEKIERFKKVLIMKSRTLCIQTILSCELWFEFYKTANYFNNRIFRKILNWIILIKILIHERLKLFHIQSYDCRINSLRHIIVRKTKMKFRAMINPLMRHDSINVFRVWISSKMRIIRIRDVLFDSYSFCDSCVLDLKHFLSIKMKNVIQILKMLEITFDNVLIEQNDDDSKELIFETFFKKIDELMIDLIDFQVNLKNSVFNEISQMIIFEMISNREIHSSTTFAISGFDHIVILSMSKVINQIEIVIQNISQKIQINSKTAQHFSIDSIFDVQIRFESMTRQAKFDSFNSFNRSNSKRRTKAKSSADFVTINIRSRTRK